MNKVLYLVRHGLTDWNVQKKMQGHSNIPLNDTGKLQAKSLQDFFINNPDYGYNLVRDFDLKGNKKNEIKESNSFVLEHRIDEIYASISALNNREINDLIYFADNNLKTVKFLPDSKNTFLRNLAVEYYDYIPIISLMRENNNKI